MDLTASGLVRRVSLETPDGRNAIDDDLIDRLSRALDDATADPDCRVVVVEGSDGVFSTGMDLVHAGGEAGDDDVAGTGGAFFDLLDRFTTVPVVVVSAVDGTVAGGGVGVVAASASSPPSAAPSRCRRRCGACCRAACCRSSRAASVSSGPTP